MIRLLKKEQFVTNANSENVIVIAGTPRNNTVNTRINVPVQCGFVRRVNSPNGDNGDTSDTGGNGDDTEEDETNYLLYGGIAALVVVGGIFASKMLKK